MKKNNHEEKDLNEEDSIWSVVSEIDENEETEIDSNNKSSSSTSSSTVYYKNETDSNPTNDEDVSYVDDEMISRRKILVFGGIAIASVIPLGIGTGYFYKKNSVKKEASKKLSLLASSRGTISPVNTDLKTFKGQTLENVNINQKALVGGNDNTSDEAAVFIYGNGKSGDKRIVDLFIDFDAQRSRDCVLVNQSSFKGMVEGGLIELRVHPTASSSALSIYSPEALAETFVTTPSVAWDFMLSLLKLSAEIQANNDIEILPAIEEKVKEHGISDVSAESIQNGTFSSWIVEVGNDERLRTGYYPPIMYVNDIIIDPDMIDFNNPDKLRAHILDFETKE